MENTCIAVSLFLERTIEMAERRDNKNRILQKGEYQKNDGRYMYRYTDTKGNTRFVYSWTLTQTDRSPKSKHSDKCLREMEKEIAKSLQEDIDIYKSKKMTLNAFYEDYISQKQELKTSTRVNYKYMYRKYVWDNIGQKKIFDIKYSDIKKFYNYLINDVGFKPNSMETIHIVLHPIFSAAVRDGYIRVNPTEGVMNEIKKSNSWDKPKRHPLSTAEQEAFINFIKNHKTYRHWLPMFTVFLGTGCRVGEIIGLTWDDCDFKNNIININHNLVYRVDEETGKSKFYITTPKTNAGTRVIPMFNGVRKALLEERERQMNNGFSEIIIDGYSGFVFTNRFNSVYLPNTINKAISRISRDYNIEECALAERQNREPLLIPHFTVHNLRHTFCTRMCENEPNIKVIQEIMGHADIATTMNIYNEATLDKKRESFSNLEGKIKIC